jgi:hypothetical protein
MNLTRSPEFSVNDTGTNSKTDTPLTQQRSLDVLARHLIRLRPGHSAGRMISDLIQQLGNYERNPDSLRPLMIRTMQRIEEARR